MMESFKDRLEAAHEQFFQGIQRIGLRRFTKKEREFLALVCGVNLLSQETGNFMSLGSMLQAALRKDLPLPDPRLSFLGVPSTSFPGGVTGFAAWHEAALATQVRSMNESLCASVVPEACVKYLRTVLLQHATRLLTETALNLEGTELLYMAYFLVLDPSQVRQLCIDVLSQVLTKDQLACL